MCSYGKVLMHYSRQAPSSAILRRERIYDRRILNCVDNPRNVFNVTTLNSPASLDTDYLLKWIAEKPPLTAFEATELLDGHEPLFLIDVVCKYQTGMLNYESLEAQDVIIVWDWSRTWLRQPGNKLKSCVPALKKVMTMEARALKRRDEGRKDGLLLPLDTSLLRPLTTLNTLVL